MAECPECGTPWENALAARLCEAADLELDFQERRVQKKNPAPKAGYEHARMEW